MTKTKTKKPRVHVKNLKAAVKTLEKAIEAKKPKKERLVHQTCVRFTPEQWKLVNAYAKRTKTDLAEAIRTSVLYFSQPIPRPS